MLRNHRPVIGVISDTHGLLRKEALDALEGSDLIVHAGDVGKREIFEALKELAPVTAVRGNIDRDSWGSTLPLTAMVEVDNAKIYVLHILDELAIDPAQAGCKMVVSGHSHKPGHTTKSGVIYLNPGSAGPRRFRLPITVARIELTRPAWTITLIDLQTGHPFIA